MSGRTAVVGHVVAAAHAGAVELLAAVAAAIAAEHRVVAAADAAGVDDWDWREVQRRGGRIGGAPRLPPHLPEQSTGVAPKHTPAQSLSLFPPPQTPQSSDTSLPPHTPAQSTRATPPHTPAQSTSPRPKHGRDSGGSQLLSWRVWTPHPHLAVQRDQPCASAPLVTRRRTSAVSARNRRRLLVSLGSRRAPATRRAITRKACGGVSGGLGPAAVCAPRCWRRRRWGVATGWGAASRGAAPSVMREQPAQSPGGAAGRARRLP